MAQVDVTRDMDALETHLTERIATLTENSMEVNALQGQTLDNLNKRVQELLNEIDETKARSKIELEQ